MSLTARRLRLLAGVLAAGTAGILGVTAALGGPIASADPAGPVFGSSPISPATVTQTVTVAAAPAAAQPAPAVVPAAVAAGAPGAVPAAVPAPAPAAEVPTIVPATTQTLAEFFAAHHVGMHAQKAADFKALNIVLPMPTGWTQVPDPNVPDAFAVLADRVGGDGLYSSNAAVVVYELTGDFDPKDAISHGFVDSAQLPVWRPTAASMADFGGMPSALVEGTYRQNDMTLNTARRHVIATSGSAHYLVSLSVTTSVSASVASGQATDGILNGFRVSVPGAPAPAPAAAPAAPTPAAAAAAPAVPVAQPVSQPVSVAASSQLLGLPR